MNRIKSICIICIFLSTGLSGQELNPEQQKYISGIIEVISEDIDESIDLSDIFNDLVYYYQYPLNINSANKEQLASLYILNDFQIASIIEYRDSIGQIYSVYELGYLYGFSTDQIELIKPFVFCGPIERQPQTINKKAMQYANHILIIRYQRVLEKQEGYLELTDSLTEDHNAKSYYLGSPDKIYARYQFRLKDIIQAGIVMEKDAGEEFMSGSNCAGFDYYSGYVAYKNNSSFIKNVVIGDYYIQSGQGLLVWSGYGFGKTSYITSIAKSSAGIKGNTSADESHFLRGAAVKFGGEKFNIIGYASSHKIDAGNADSTEQSGSFNSFYETGYHATPSEIENEKQLRINSFGISGLYVSNRFRAGVNSNIILLNKTRLSSDYLYNAFSFIGNRLSGFSVDYKYIPGKLQFFGETSYSNNSYATLNGILLYATPGVTLGAVYRYYSHDYYSYYSNSFGENSDAGNENGLFLGGEIKITEYNLRFYGDIFSFPWLKYRVNAPSEGNEFYLEAGRSWSLTDIYIRYKRQEKPRNIKVEDNIYELKSLINEQIRLNQLYTITEKISLQSRIEISRVIVPKEIMEYGFLIFQDCNLSEIFRNTVFSLRLAYFNISYYDARIYAYERDVLYAFNSHIHYGKGWRFFFMTKWQPVECITFWFRISHSLFPGEKEIGSGLNTISLNHKTEIKLQSVFRF